jgi:hypothetical protein
VGREHTPCEGRHGQNARKHALVVSIEDTAQAGKQRNAEDLKVLDQSRRATLAHQSLTPFERGIKASGSCTSTTHDDYRWIKVLERW